MIQVADHRSVPGFPNRQKRVVLAADLDPLLSELNGFGPSGV